MREGQMKKHDARLAVLREYDRWAKKHPNDAKKMGGFVFFGYLEKEGQTFSISVPSANGKPFTAGFVTEVDRKINAAKAQRSAPKQSYSLGTFSVR